MKSKHKTECKYCGASVDNLTCICPNCRHKEVLVRKLVSKSKRLKEVCKGVQKNSHWT